jgi:predicted DNA-binding transcriptional regulator YafY
MAKPITPHPHSDRPAFDRLMLLIATILAHPGIGSPEPEHRETDSHHDALASVAHQLQTFAQTQGHPLPAYSTPTLRKDLETLRRYHILQPRMYRWGYYLGTAALSPQELSTALQALALQAQKQGDPSLRRMHDRLSRRLRGLDLPPQLTYPVRAQLDQLIIHTDPEELRHQGNYKATLYDHLPKLETAITEAQALELIPKGKPSIRVFPLQLLYHEIAWYLLYETLDSGHFGLWRIDRLSDHCQVLPETRDLSTQLAQLKIAERLLQDGWGLFLGNPDQQKLEREGQLPLTEVRVRFYGKVIRYIQEGDRRHPRQRITHLKKDDHGKAVSIDYEIRLPDRSLDEFFRWVYRFADAAQVMAPPDWVEVFRRRARAQCDRYL